MKLILTKPSMLLKKCLQTGLNLCSPCPPRSQTVKSTFLYSIFSTLKPAMQNKLLTLQKQHIETLVKETVNEMNLESFKKVGW